MLGLDIDSVVFFILFGYTLSLIGFVLYIILGKRNDVFLKIFVLGKSFQIIVWGVFYFFHHEFSNTLISLMNSILFIGCSLEVYSYYAFSGKNLKKIRRQLCYITVTGAIFYFLFRNQIIIREAIYSGFLSVIYGYLFYGFALNKKATKMKKVLGWMAFLFILTHIARGAFTISEQYELPLFTNIPMEIVNGLIWTAIGIGSPLLLLFIIEEEDKQKLTELVATKNKIFRIIGHDLKGPISQFIQFSELIQLKYDRLSDEEIKYFLNLMKTSSLRSLGLLENLLEWARTQTGTFSFHPTAFSFLAIIKENKALLERQADIKNIKVDFSEIQDVTVFADKNMISTVVRNLLSNAIKFTGDKGLIQMKSCFKKNRFKFSISDTGIGIPDETIDDIFTVHKEVTTLGTGNEKGTGLGLIICKEFIDLHKGRIWVKSKKGKGTTFCFTIPQLENQ